MTDLINRIDSLIDEQLSAGEPLNGYDYDDPDYPECWHCGRDWHGLKITERIENMRMYGSYDEDYSYADDDSRVICPGSTFIGPVMSPATRNWYIQQSSWQLPQPEYHYPNSEEWIWGTQRDYQPSRGYTLSELERIRSYVWERRRQRRDIQFSIQIRPNIDAPWVRYWDESFQEVNELGPERVEVGHIVE